MVETSTSSTTHESTTSSSGATSSFAAGNSVMYGLIGKCTVAAVETKNVSGQTIAFYKLEPSRNTLSRASKPEPAIWIPIHAAAERGLRAPIDAAGVDAIWEILSNKEYYFSLTDTWSVVYPKLEAAIRSDGAVGLAKVAGFLHVMKNRQVVLSPEVNRFQETVNRILWRELAEALGSTSRQMEIEVTKRVRPKIVGNQ